MYDKLRKLIMLTSLTLIASCAFNDKKIKDEGADLVLSNGKVYTMNLEQEWAEAVAIKDGKIIAVATNDAIAKHIGPQTKTVNLENKMVLPSFQDTHIHPMMGGLAYSGCALFDLVTLEKTLEKIAQCVEDNPKADFIRGNGWGWGLFINNGKPNKQLLDAIDDSRPLIFGDSDGHTQWVNSAALKFANITADTANPEGGEIGRLEGSDEPSGTLIEGPAMELLLGKLPTISLAEKEAALLYAQDYLHSLGITAMQDAYVGLTGNLSDRVLNAYRSLQEKDKLKLRVVTALYWEPGQGMGQINAMRTARETYSKDRLQVSSVKFWADGILEAHTAKLLEPYNDKPETEGLLMVPLDEMMAAVPLLDADGFQIHIHAIGDATVRYALDALEKARDQNGVRDSRHLTAHTQQVNPDDVGRFAELNVTANFSPYWAMLDDYTKTINPPQLGEERMRQMYPIKDIIDAGGRVAFGSDWSVSTADPLLGIETAITRKDPESAKAETLNREQGISLHEAIAGYTSDAAFTNFLDSKTGSIEVGKYADLVILSENLFGIPVEEISDSSVQATLLEGELVYGEF